MIMYAGSEIQLFTPLLSTPDLKNKFFMIIFVIKTKPILETTEKEKLYDKTSLYFTTIKKLIKKTLKEPRAKTKTGNKKEL